VGLERSPLKPRDDNWGAISTKPKLTALRIRCADHATLCPPKLALTSPTSGGHSVGIVPLWTKIRLGCRCMACPPVDAHIGIPDFMSETGERKRGAFDRPLHGNHPSSALSLSL
jgi:hypothetical protein